MASPLVETVTVRVLLFGRYAELLGLPELSIELERPATIASLLAELRNRAGGSELPPSPLAARNHEHAALTTELEQGDEVAVLPPLAGG